MSTPTTVFVLHRDVEYEFGTPLGVYSSKENAKKAGDVWVTNSGLTAKGWFEVDGRLILGMADGWLEVLPFVLDDEADQ